MNVVQDSVFACESSLLLLIFFMNCIIDQCYVCQSLVNFSTYTSICDVITYHKINILYFSFIFLSSYCEHESKESKIQTTLCYISRTRLHR